MNNKWTSIRSVLDKLSQVLVDYNEIDVIENCAEAMEMIGVQGQYQLTTKVLHIDKYTAKLPTGLVQINQLAYKLDSQISSTDQTELARVLGIDNESTMQDSNIIGNYKADILNSNYIKYKWAPLRLATGSFSGALHSDDCINLTCTFITTSHLWMSMKTF